MPPKHAKADNKRPDALAWTLLASLSLFVAMVAPFLAGRITMRDDLGAFHLPLRAFYAEQLAEGEPFDWMPGLFGGFYLTGEGQAGMYHPTHRLYYSLLPLGTALACEYLASYPFMLIGMFLFLRRRLGRSDASLFGAMVFTFCGFNLLHFLHPNAIAVIAHTPWMLWAIDVAMNACGRRRLAMSLGIIAVLTGSQLLLGYPQYVWFSLLAEVSYIAFAICEHKSKHCSYARQSVDGAAFHGRPTSTAYALASVATRLAAAKGVGLMIGAVQLLPTIDALDRSVRHSADAAFSNWGSASALNASQLLGPYWFTNRVLGGNTHELGVYFGAVPLMLVVYVVCQRHALGAYAKLAAAAATFAGFTFLLSLGENGVLYRLQHYLPLIGGFRFPSRYMVLTHLALGVLAAIGLVQVMLARQRGEKTPWPRLRLIWIVVGGSVAMALVGLGLQERSYVGPVAGVLIGPVLLATAAALLTAAVRGVRGAVAGLILFAALDLGVYGLSYSVYSVTYPMDEYLSLIRLPPGDPDERVLADLIRFDESGLHTGDQMTMAGWRRIDGYVGLEPGRRLDYSKHSALRAAGVRWVKQGEKTKQIEGLIPRGNGWLESPSPLARVRLVTTARQSNTPAEDIVLCPIETVALTDRPLPLSGGPAGEATLTSDRPGRLCVEVECDSDQLLVISESFHPGWKAWVDGRPCQPLPVNGDFLGCRVGAGDREVRLEFQPQSLRNGLWLSLLGLTLLPVVMAGAAIGPICSNRSH